MESITIQHLGFRYPQAQRQVLADVSFTIPQGQFVVLCGPSGCGKTTLLRQLKTVLAPHGQREGTILFEAKPLAQWDQRQQSAKIGFVLQNPENQIVTDKVWHELAFGLESLGYDSAVIRLRVAEMASFFGIEDWFYKNVSELSGGQKQLLNLAAIMAMQPSLLILDEPTSQLDPIAAQEFLETVAKINRELGVTVLMTEHRLDEALPLADRAIVMDRGRILADGTPQEVGQQLRQLDHDMFLAMPVPMRVYAGVPNDLPCPITVRQGRQWLEAYAAQHPVTPQPPANLPQAGATVLELKDVWFRYERTSPDVVKGLSLQVQAGEFLAILGGNGTGKTTMLSLLAGLRQPYRGQVLLEGKPLADHSPAEKFQGMLAMLPQNPQSLFVKKTVQEDLAEVLRGRGLTPQALEAQVARVVELCRLGALLEQHPYDLSGGEQQRAALAKVLLLGPEILLLDEPTKGLDAEFKQEFAAILRHLLAGGTTIVMVSHDIEFCAKYAHRCALFFDGNVVSAGTPVEFFSGNSFYTTAANRMARQWLPQAVTAEQVIEACGGEIPPEPEQDWDRLARVEQELALATTADSAAAIVSPPQAGKGKKPLSNRRFAVAILALVAFLIGVRGLPGLKNMASTSTDLMRMIAESPEQLWRYAGTLLLLTGAVIAFCSALFVYPDKRRQLVQVPPEQRKLTKRTLVAAVMILVLIPLTIFIGYYYFGDRKYYFIASLIILETMLPFVMLFESRKPQARELIIIAVLCALGVAGRAAFFMLPQFKPVVAIVIIAGVAFGGEAGFLVGAVVGMVSNMLLGQGPWTPWQMFSFGIIGFLAGVLFRKGLLCRNRLPLAIFGGVTTFCIYGGIMNPCALLMSQVNPTPAMFLLYYLQGVPFDLIHAAATVCFLWLFSQPMLEKLDRIKVKYGMLETE